MSPEQAEGRPLDARSDVFSFGSVLYEMLTGRRPFTGESTVRLLARVVSEDPTPAAQLRPSLAPELDAIVRKCLRKDPARRYQTTADLRGALLDVAEAQAGDGKRRATTRDRAVRALLLVAAVAVLVAAVAGLRTWRGLSSEESPSAIPLTALPGPEHYPSLSRDGNSVAFTWNGLKGDNPDVYVQLVDSPGPPLRLTTDAANDYDPGRTLDRVPAPARRGRRERAAARPSAGRAGAQAGRGSASLRRS